MAELPEAAFIGKNGPGKTEEGDLKTPLGTFGFNAALGINDDPGCAIPFDKMEYVMTHVQPDSKIIIRMKEA